MTEPTGTRTFSTDSLAPERSAAMWREYMAEVYYDLDITPVDRTSVTGTIAEVSLGTIGVSTVQVDAQRVIRRKAAIRRDEEESFILVFSRRGAVDIRQGSRAGRLRPGGVCILNAAEHYQCDVPDATENVTLKIPCHLLRARLPWIDDLTARDRIADPALLPLVRHFAADLIALPPMGPATAQRLEGLCLDMVTTMLDAGRRGRSGGRRSRELPDVVLAELRTFIDRHLGRCGLNAGDAALACSISPRQVQLLFQRVGTSFGRELVAARLRRADAMLRSADSDRLSIGEIAFRCGFTSQAHFAARYRRVFDRTPREARAGLPA